MHQSFYLLFLAVLLAASGRVSAQQEKYNLSEESNIYTKIPDLELMTESGTFKISEVYDRSPVMMALIFTRCAGICSPFTFNVQDNIERLKTNREYKIIVVSFDPRDSLEDMLNYKKRFKLAEEDRWIFATTPDIDEMNNALGFDPVWDEQTLQFEHEALLAGLNEHGYLTKKLLGMRTPNEVLSVINSINNVFTPAYPLPVKNRLFTCFTYDPSTGKRSGSFGLFILLSPAVLTAALVSGIRFRKRLKVR